MSKQAKAKRIVKSGIKAALQPRRAYSILQLRKISKQTNNARDISYREWFADQELTKTQLDDQTKKARKLKYQPLVSIIVPIYNTNKVYFRECLDSVINQTYSNWELCIADDASTTDILEVVKDYENKYGSKKIKWTRLKKNMHIAGASNEALKLAKGEFIALLDHDDILTPNALFEMVNMLNNNPKADLIYSDEDKIEEGKGHIEPFFKPDWSPDFLKSCNYITHFAFIRSSLVRNIGGFTVGTEGAQDWDLLLRISQETSNIFHLPKIIYSWRKSETSTAKDATSKPYAYIKQRMVLRNACKESPQSASVLSSPALGFWRVRYGISGNPKVSIIIPTKDNHKLLKKCILSIIDKSSFPNYEIILVDTGSKDKDTFDFYNTRIVESNNIKIVNWEGAKFNFSAACNTGVKSSTGEYLLFLNNDTEVMNEDWIESLLEHAQRSEVGMVGAKLFFPDDTIQHAGVVLAKNDVAFHPFYGQDPRIDVFINIYLANIRNCSAVTAACSMVSRDKFEEVGGFDEELWVTYNDVDLCLKLLDSGYNNIYTPYSTLYHHESVSVGRITSSDRDKDELYNAQEIMKKRWGKYLERDPYYNDNFNSTGVGYRLPNYIDPTADPKEQ